MKKLITLLLLFLVMSGFIIYSGDDGGIVKSKLTDFNVYSQDDHIKITWSTKSRKDIEYFMIERSRDAKKFEAYRKVNDEGVDPKTMEFFEIDSQPLPGWSYYRIREVMSNGDSAYSNIAPVFFGMDRLTKGTFIAAKSPNDPPEKLNLTQFKGKQVLMVVRDQSGAEYYINDVLNVISNRIVVPAGKQVPAGNFIVTASSLDELLGMQITAQ
jgi:hypothetical protein